MVGSIGEGVSRDGPDVSGGGGIRRSSVFVELSRSESSDEAMNFLFAILL